MNLKEKIKFTLNNNIPFVSYRKPNDNKVKLIIQNSNEINYLVDYSKKGFVFAPFNDTEKTIYFPLEKCNILDFQFSNIKFKETKFEFIVSKDVKNNHIKLVEKGIDFIKKNNTPKIVLSRKETFLKKDFNAITTFLNLLNNYKTAFVYIWFHPKVGLWLGATPETLLQVKNNNFNTMALAGTQDYKNTVDVNWGNKEIDEQNLVTTFIASQLKKLKIAYNKSAAYTVVAGSLLHLKSDISGRFNSDNQLDLIINALHPTPAVCGLPKEKAKEFILKNENYNREFYTGFLGELNMETPRKKNRRNIENQAYNLNNKITNLFVNLRCMQVKNKEINLYIGGGITKNSIPKNEFLETIAKSKIIKKCL